MQRHRDSVIQCCEHYEGHQKITVRRRHVWEDTKRALQRPSFNPTTGLEICFIGEEAQDVGGPL